jgi:hypothetical protein
MSVTFTDNRRSVRPFDNFFSEINGQRIFYFNFCPYRSNINTILPNLNYI